MSRAFALSGSNLISFSTTAPSFGTTIGISGIAAGESLVGIDFRPQNGLLYGLGINATNNTGTLYLISDKTGVATAVGTSGGISFLTGGGTQIDLPDPATVGYGFDFNPAADRIRVTTGNGLNFRINPNTGAPIDGDLGGAAGSVTFVNPDGAINGGTTGVSAAAYTNNQPNNGSVTTLYTLDETSNTLFIQTPPNAGTETTSHVVTLGGNPLDFSSVGGFDIPAGVNAPSSNAAVASGSGLALLSVGGVIGLYSIDLSNGSATKLGNFLNGATAVSGLAIESNPGGIPAIGLSADGQSLVRFNTASTGTTTTQATSGVAAGEALVGIDFRPQTGQLYGLGINATTNTGTLYLIDPQTGAATAIGSTGSIAFVDAIGNAVDLPASGYGFDFNPTVDRIRVTTDSGLNFRINPNSGSPIDGDIGGAAGSVAGINIDHVITGGASGASAVAYTNSYAQALTGGATTQYVLDAATNSLFIQNGNSGIESSQHVITLANGSTLDFTAVSGFDIPSHVHVSASGNAAGGFGYADLTVGGVTSLYRIDLGTGLVTNLGAIGAGATQLAGLTLADTPPPPVVHSDLNGDAHSDIFWRNDNNSLAVWTMSGAAGNQVLTGNGIGSTPDASWHVQATGDFNGDGTADFLWRNDNNTLAVWTMGGIAGTTIQTGNAIGSMPGASWHVQGAADFNGDGRHDILWRNDDNTLAVWTMGGSAGNTIQTGNAIGSMPDASWHVQGLGDFNGDGNADILWRNNNGTFAVWTMGGQSGAQVLTGNAIGSVPPVSWHVNGIADFNGDGRSDILLRHDNGTLVVWTMGGIAGNQILSGNAIASMPDASWHVQDAGDFNADGRGDILWRNDSGQLVVFAMSGSDGTQVLSGSAIGSMPDNTWHVQAHQFDIV